MDKNEEEDDLRQYLEPLPYMDYKYFSENGFNQSDLSIHINPHSDKKYSFVPNQPIRIQIKAEKQPLHGYILHPYIYLITIEHLKRSWHVHKNLKEIREVHKTLSKMIKAELGVRCADIPKDQIKPDWPLFPTKYDTMIAENKIITLCKLLTTYLERVLKYPPYRDHPSMLKLLGVSPLSFTLNLSPSLKEDLLYKKSGDIMLYGSCMRSRLCCQKLKVWHEKRWVCLKDTYLVYSNQITNYTVSFVMLVDAEFKCKTKITAGAYHAIELMNMERRLLLKFRNAHQQQEWYDQICSMLSTTGRLFNDRSLLTYESYAPRRTNQLCRWYVNASQYMEHIMIALENAKEEIYIADWWLCPELYLKRPTDDPDYRLDKILIKKAREGVKVYILLYKEVTIALNLHTTRTRQILTEFGLNQNVKVLRHPDHFFDGVFMWSHHEKFVIVDQSVAFLGGIDLCYGRWDDEEHRLIDLGIKQNITNIEDPNGTKPLHSSQSDSNLTGHATHSGNLDSLEENVLSSTPDKRRTELITPRPPVGNESLSNLIKNNPLVIRKKISDNELKMIRAFTHGNMAFNPVRENNSTSSNTPPPPQSKSNNKIKQSSESESTQQPLSTKPPAGFIKPASIQRQPSKIAEMKRRIWVGNTYSKYNSSNQDRPVTRVSTPPTTSNAVRIEPLSSARDKIPSTNEYRGGGANKSRQSRPPAKAPDSKEDELNQSYKKQVKWLTSKDGMIRSKKTTLNDIFRGTINKKQTNKNDDIYDRYYNSRHNEAFLKDEDLPKNTDAGYYYWIGKEYANSYREDFRDVNEYMKDQFDRNEIPRMPWRDQGAVIVGHAAQDLARHFIQRWNQCKNEQVPNLDLYPYLIPKSYSEPFTYNPRQWLKEDLYKCSVQMLRSAGDWSTGVSITETSILNAYCDVIKNAEHYIYMENQFFITTTNPDKDSQVKNTIGLALVDRIKRAHQLKQKFRVIIFLPLLPGFDRMNTIKAVQYYNLRSIKFGEYSIYKELHKAGIEDPSEYITFHGMRNWAVLMGKLVQEIIYVHSKLMIVDDKYTLVGSANINDRSMLGKRDSEVGALIKDEEFVESILNGRKVKVGKYASSLRQKIFKLHLGIYFNNPKMVDVTDCVSDEFYKLFKSVSHQNTLIYDEVFKCLPSDSILTFHDLKNFSKQTCLNKTDPVEGKSKMEKCVTGLVVDFPLNFLGHEKNFFPDLNTPEGLVPTEFWT